VILRLVAGRVADNRGKKLYFLFGGKSGDIYEQAFVKTFAGFFHGNSK
jgi:hypothetical protein